MTRAKIAVKSVPIIKGAAPKTFVFGFQFGLNINGKDNVFSDKNELYIKVNKNNMSIKIAVYPHTFNNIMKTLFFLWEIVFIVRG
tara:strand:- start:3261 stop:3515 length:255 start_codon:yes stop_codon:yes gene_type:complete